VIIIETAFPLSEITEEFAGVAIDDYLPKPYSKFNINQLIIKHFKSKY
jgi:two-component SAPR family response regulator